MQNNLENKYLLYAVLALSLLILDCQGERKETPTKGRVTVVVSESVAPALQQEQQKFEELYPEAHVELQVATAREAVARMFNDTITTIVSSRPLNAEEREVQKHANVKLGEYKIAIDGIVVIVNNINSITQLRTTQLDSILSGKITKWNQVGSHLKSTIETCLPSRNTGTFEVMVMKLVKTDTVVKPTAVARSSDELIHYVEVNPNAIGMIGSNWLKANKERVKALELSDPNVPDSLGTKGKYFGPHPAYIYQGYYPLSRNIYVYSRADNYGVAAGFISFIMSAPGQKIFLNNDLVPATMPVRLVETTNRPLQ